MFIFPHRSQRSLSALFTLFLFFLATLSSTQAALPKKPKLVVLLVIDQFRADYLRRFESQFLPAISNSKIGGFRYLMEKGAYAPAAEYEILHSITGPGHATLSTGAYPYQMGIGLNEWFDAKTKSKVYCTEDPDVALVGTDFKDAHWGASPKLLHGSTFGDELKLISPKSRAVSISLKDRSAILMGGHLADLSLWMDDRTTQWISSRHYIPSGGLPEWVQKLNQGLIAKDAYQWNPITTSKHKGTFPKEAKIKTRQILALPFGLHATRDAALAALKEYQLGKRDVPDVLTVSFSTHDYLGHNAGPESLEMEELTKEEDRVLSDFFSALQKHLKGGLDDAVIVLSADHGIAPNPDLIDKNKMASGRIDEKKLTEIIQQELDKKFGTLPGNWILFCSDLNFYFNHEQIRAKKIDLAEIESTVKQILLAQPGIRFVFTRTDYHKRQLPPALVGQQAMHTYLPERSGDVVGVPEPFFFSSGVTVNHQTGYAYDRTVPLIFVGPQIQTATFPDKIRVIDLAPTLSYLLGTNPPSGAEGRVLSEIFKK